LRLPIKLWREGAWGRGLKEGDGGAIQNERAKLEPLVAKENLERRSEQEFNVHWRIGGWSSVVPGPEGVGKRNEKGQGLRGRGGAEGAVLRFAPSGKSRKIKMHG